MATTAVPDGVILDLAVRGADGSPSQERLLRIAAMLRDADRAMPPTTNRERQESRGRRRQRGPRRRRAV